LSQYSDPITGLIKIEQAGIDTTDKSLQGQITTLTDRINAQQASLSKQLAAADAFEARLESQQKGVTASLQGLSLVLYGKNPTQ
jgi:flagellar capping protein FliD